MTYVYPYSLAVDGEKKLAPNFTVKEFSCRDGSDAVLVAPLLSAVLQDIRRHFNAPVSINSAYRTPSYNAKVKGAARSKHCLGLAADITVKGAAPAEVAAFARQLMPDWGGVGIYSTFTHIDVRDERADWRG